MCQNEKNCGLVSMSIIDGVTCGYKGMAGKHYFKT